MLDDPSITVLFSTVPRIAIEYNRTLYNDLHYMYCAPFVGMIIDGNNPDSSIPAMRYNQLKREVEQNETSGPYIDAARAGIIKGLGIKAAAGVIGVDLRDEKIREVGQAAPIAFSPVLCQVNIFGEIRRYFTKHIYKGNPLSIEYIASDLPGKYIRYQLL